MFARMLEAFRSVLDVFFDEKWFRLYANLLFILALLLVKYGAGFTWRQVLYFWLAACIWTIGSALSRHVNKPPKFKRIQFRIGITDLGQALIDAGINTAEEIEQNNALSESLGTYSSGYITFTWLEPELYFMNDSSRFAESPELSISLKPFGERAKQIRSWVGDCIELRGTLKGYELALIKAEHRKGWAHPEGDVLTLMMLPYEFIHSLQKEPSPRESLTAFFDRQREMLERTGLKYLNDLEVREAWDYKGKYAVLHWWEF